MEKDSGINEFRNAMQQLLDVGQFPTTNFNLLDDDDDDNNNNNNNNNSNNNNNLESQLTIERWIEHFNEILTSNSVIQITEELMYRRTVLNTEPYI